MKNKPFRIEYHWTEIAKAMRPFLRPIGFDACQAIQRLERRDENDWVDPFNQIVLKLEKINHTTMIRMYRKDDISESKWLENAEKLCDFIMTILDEPT